MTPNKKSGCIKIIRSSLFIPMILLSCCNKPIADFEANTTSPKAGANVKLTDMSDNEPDTWEWELSPENFEYQDGTGSGSQDPVVLFSAVGSYTVTLTVSNSAGTDTETKKDYITVLNDHSPIVVVHSPGLEDNLLGDSPDREVRVYLPPDYFDNTSKHYPVIYLLHGYFADHNIWYDGLNDIEMDIETALNTLIQEGVIEPMIVVAPDSYNRYFGSMYTNSSTAGQWEDFITEDVVHYTDDHFRTIPERGSRGIGGHSMGGCGAIRIAMKHPELFSVLYAGSPGIICFEDVFFGYQKQYMITASQLESLTRAGMYELGPHAGEIASCAACAPAFAPNPNVPPFYGDFPVTADGQKIDSTWQRWLEHDLYVMLPVYQNNLKQLNAILFDCGDADEFLVINEKFSQALTGYGVTHTFQEFIGNHTYRVQERISGTGFPFFSDHLVHE